MFQGVIQKIRKAQLPLRDQAVSLMLSSHQNATVGRLFF